MVAFEKSACIFKPGPNICCFLFGANRLQFDQTKFCSSENMCKLICVLVECTCRISLKAMYSVLISNCEGLADACLMYEMN